MRTRRAVALADLLQRQVLVDNVDIPTPNGEPLTAATLQEKGQHALDGLRDIGLLPPDRGRIVQAKILKPGVVVFTTSSADIRLQGDTRHLRELRGRAPHLTVY